MATKRARGKKQRRAIWDRPNPKRGTGHRMTRAQRAKARASARRRGQRNPSLVDNINAMRSQ
jgi:hypothetical protein